MFKHRTTKHRSFFRVLLPLVIGATLAALISLTIGEYFNTIDEKIRAVSIQTAYYEAPLFVDRIKLEEDGVGLKPYAIAYQNGYYFISALNSGRITVLDGKFKFKRSIHLKGKVESSLTGIAVDDERLYTADILNAEIRVNDMQGNELSSFGWLPEKSGRIKPHGITAHNGVLYITDVWQKKVLAISVTDVEGLTASGELLFSAPLSSSSSTIMNYPAVTVVTPDGRLVVSDFESGDVKVFTCNGRFAYDFEKTSDSEMKAPNGVAIDNLSDPDSLNANPKSFDPSGIRSQGRIHVLDSRSGDVVVFDPRGKYILRYGGDDLNEPNGILINHDRRLIVIVDTGSSSLVLYKY